MDRVQDVVRHPNELVVSGKGMKALCHETGDSLHSVAQAKRVCRQGILGEDIWGDRLPTDELCHDVGEGEGEGAQVFPRWVRSQIGSELAL
jgi:hypothetical protein